MSAGWIALLVLLAGAIATIAALRRGGRPSVEAGPKAPGKPQADPALSPLVETQGAPPGLASERPPDRVSEEMRERARRDGERQ